ncbi:hypothetical protein KKC91_03750 [bacterium]|nr:hypothetical protein [bacterium]
MRNRQYKPRYFRYIDVVVNYVPFPDEKAREHAYDTHVKLFLRAQERMLRERRGKYSKQVGEK